MQAPSTQPFQILSREELSPVTIQLTVEVDALTTQRMFERTLRILGKYIDVPGFRRGQAPLNILRRIIPEENLRRAAGELMMDEFIPKVLQQEQIEPYRAPRVDIERLQEGEPFRFKLTVPLRPIVEKLGEYRDLRFPIPPQETTDEEVEQALESLRKQRMRLESAPDRPAQTDDRLVVGIQSLEEENAKRNRYMMTLGATFGALDNLLAGMREGETKEATLTFPENFDDPDLAGKTLTVAVTLERVYAPVYPDLDDAFAQQHGYDDLNAMREGIRQRITQRKVEYLQDQAREQALAILRERSVVHLPDALIDEQLREEAEEFAQELKQNGLTLEMFAQGAGLTREQVVEQLRQRGITRLQNTFLLMALADREGIEVTESELDEVAESVSPDTEPEIRARMKSDPEVRQQIAHQLRIEYALQKLLDIVQNREQGD
ncbi:trigger factor [Synechococcus sp. RC10A2]|uniref:trigger factor n=1 Tax=Synechococcus sp. RC10A2 TaxID=2964529 RepID=UPI0039C623D3